MNNNTKLRQYLTSNNAASTLGITGRQIADASQEQLKRWVSDLGMNPHDILEAKDSPTPAPVPTSSEAEDKLRALQDLLGGGSASMDMDKVRDAVQEAIANDVSPSLEKMQNQVDALSPLADTLDKIADAMKGGASSRLPLAVATASGNNPILELIQPYYDSGSANPTKVCISAPPSYGKSYSISLLGQSYDHCITHGCSDDMDEWHEIIGGATPREDGNGFIVSDGKLANAVRLASKGESVLFFMDEVFRLSPKVMEKMLDFLAPQPDADGIKRYKLTTKHNDKGVLETLTCAMDNLHIICATNLCEVIPPEAFRSRFLFKHVQFDPAMVANIATSVATKFGITDAADLGGRFAMAMERSREMKASGQLLTSLDIRNLETACTHSSDSTGASVLMWMCANGLDGLKAWDSDTGDITLDSINGVAELATILA
jgi:hypothetical protein